MSQDLVRAEEAVDFPVGGHWTSKDAIAVTCSLQNPKPYAEKILGRSFGTLLKPNGLKHLHSRKRGF